MKENEILELKELLRFAWHNFRYEIPVADSESEFDWCCVCGSEDWNHKDDCKALAWEKRVREILG